MSSFRDKDKFIQFLQTETISFEPTFYPPQAPIKIEPNLSDIGSVNGNGQSLESLLNIILSKFFNTTVFGSGVIKSSVALAQINRYQLQYSKFTPKETTNEIDEWHSEQTSYLHRKYTKNPRCYLDCDRKIDYECWGHGCNFCDFMRMVPVPVPISYVKGLN